MPITMFSPNANRSLPHVTNSFIDSRSTFSMPSFNIASELLAGVKDAIVVILVVDGPSERITKHAFCHRRQCIDWIRPEEGGRCRCALFGGNVVARRAELVEFILRWVKSV
jgi:hypothetical protein